MTFERKIVVSLQEVKAVIFECNKCKSRTVIIPEQLDSIPRQCPNEHAWEPKAGLGHSGFIFEAFTTSLKKLRDPLYESAGFTILLEFEEPKP